MALDLDRKIGLAAAVEELRREAPSTPWPRPAQLPLPIEADRREDAAEDAPAPAPRTGPGRPPGSRNKSTEEWRDFILARYRSPLEALAETYSRPLAELARELCCDRLEAFKIQVFAAKELAPYVHQKQPQAVQLDSKGVVHLHFSSAAPAGIGAANGDGAVVIDAETVEIESERNQLLNDDDTRELEDG